MVSLIKDLSILRKFLFINLIVFIIIGILTLVYLKSIQPGLIKKKTSNHIRVIDNTIDHLQRLSIEFNEKDIKKFLLSTRFLFQNLDRVIFIDVKNNLIADTDTLDLDPRSFSQRLDVVEFEDLTNKKKVEIEVKKDSGGKKILTIKEIVDNYAASRDYGRPYTLTQEFYDRYVLTTIKNVSLNNENVGYILISENSNEIKSAIDERKIFIIRTAILVAIVILVFSIVLNRFFLKPIGNLVDYTKIIKSKSDKKTKIENLKKGNEIRNDCDYYFGSAFYYEKELYWSVDRIHHLEDRLTELGIKKELINEPICAPEITAPATIPISKPNAFPIPINAIPIVAEVDQLLPVAKATMALIITHDGRKNDALIILNP